MTRANRSMSRCRIQRPAATGSDVTDARVSPIRRLRRLRQRRRPRYKGPSFNRMVPNILTLLGLCAGLTAHAVRAGRAIRIGRGGNHGCRRDRRSGRPVGAYAEGHVPIWRRVRQPGRFPVLRRGAGLHPLSVVAAAARRRSASSRA